MQELACSSVAQAHTTCVHHPRLKRDVDGRSCARYLRFRRLVGIDHLESPRVCAGRWEPSMPTHPAHVVVSILDGKRRRAVKEVGFPEDPRISDRGQPHDVRSEFWEDSFMKSASLEPLSAHVRTLSVLEAYLGERHEPCVTAFENELGGRVVAMGHAPWRFVEVKREQVLNASDWATRGRLPIRVAETVPLVPMVRLSKDCTEGSIVLLNAGLDRVEKATVEVRAPMTSVEVGAAGRKSVAIRPQERDGGWSVTLSDIAPWDVVALLLS